MITSDSKTKRVTVAATGQELLLEMAMVVEAVAESAFKDLPERIAMSLLADLCTSAIKNGLKSARREKEEADD